MYIDLSASSDSRAHSLTGWYQSYTTYNDRPAYKHKDKTRYLFYIDDSNGRWVVEDELGKNKTAEGVDFHGLLRHEGDRYCPEDLDASWSHVWNQSFIEPAIVVKRGNFICMKHISREICVNRTIFDKTISIPCIFPFLSLLRKH